jgi:hypothetical protein
MTNCDKAMPMQKKRLTLEQLRHKLEGRSWSDFTIRRINHGSRKKRIRRWLCVEGVFFGAYVDQGLGAPSLKVKAQGQIVVLKFIEPRLYDYLSGDTSSGLRWHHLKDLGPVVRKGDT